MQVFGLPRQVTRIASLASRQDRPNRDIVAYRRDLAAPQFFTMVDSRVSTRASLPRAPQVSGAQRLCSESPLVFASLPTPTAIQVVTCLLYVVRALHPAPVVGVRPADALQRERHPGRDAGVTVEDPR